MPYNNMGPQQLGCRGFNMEPGRMEMEKNREFEGSTILLLHLQKEI